MGSGERIAGAQAAFAAAVAELYGATRDDAPQGPLESCTCCHRREKRQLAEVDRESAPAGLMDHFAFSALRTLGEPRDVRWFAPRLLELTRRAHLSTDVDRVADLCAEDEVWSETEQAAIRRAFAALWTLWLDGAAGNGPGSFMTESAELLTGCARVGIDVRPLFAELAARRPQPGEPWDELHALAERVGWERRNYGEDPLYWGVDEAVVRCVMEDPGLAAIAEAERLRASTN